MLKKLNDRKLAVDSHHPRAAPNKFNPYIQKIMMSVWWMKSYDLDGR
jgi:hypothetical protein